MALEQHSHDLSIAFSVLTRNSGKQSSLSLLDSSLCVVDSVAGISKIFSSASLAGVVF